MTSRLATCASVLSGLSLVLSVGCDPDLQGPTPNPASLDPNVVCVEQLTTEVTLTGMGLSALPTHTLSESSLLELPEVTLIRTQTVEGEATTEPILEIPDDPTSPESSRIHWTSQEQMSFDVYPELSVEPGLYDIRVVNRNTNEGTLVQGLLGVPRPRLDEIVPDLLCGDKDNIFTLRGDFFLTLAGQQPTVTITDGIQSEELAPTQMNDCRTLPGSSGAQACREVTITISSGLLEAGNYSVSLTNPAPANCVSTESQQLTIVPRPTLSEIIPEFACLEDGDVTLTLQGSDFLDVDGAMPTLILGGNRYETTVIPSSCVDLMVMNEMVRTCTELTVTVPQGALDMGSYDASVQNPATADCISVDEISWTVVDAPSVTSVTPEAACSESGVETTFAVEGAGFLSVDGTGPTVAIGDSSFAAIIDETSCAALSGLSATVMQCTRLSVTVPGDSYAPGEYALVVTNPEPAACLSSESVMVRFVVRPTVLSALPTRVCQGGGALTITGNDFDADAIVSLGGLDAMSVEFVSDTQLVARFGSGLAVGGPHDLVVSNAPGCDDTLSGVITVTVGPQIFFADPPVVYNGINTQALLYVTGVTDNVDRVAIAPVGGGTAIDLVHTWSATRPNRVQMTVPVGTAAGTYDILLEDRTECAATLPAGLVVGETLSVSVTGINPPFGWTSSDTAVTVLGADPLPGGEVGFAALPRMYLNPSTPADGTLATPLEAVTLLTSSRATAVVPRGLPADNYDLIVVNPDGTIGFLPNAFAITPDAPALVDTISPGSIENGASESFAVLGANFRSADVTLRCQPRGGGAITILDPAESAATDSSVVASLDASTLANGAVCVVRVTNTDGTFGEFSALTVTSPSQNLGAPALSTTLTTPRRALAAASAVATRASRFVYAIGGDDGDAIPTGTTTGAMDSVESMLVDIFGTPSDFELQRYRMTSRRSFANAVRIGRFLYVAGGQDETGTALDTVERAHVLESSDRPEVSDLEIQLMPTGGLDAGLYYYRVAAVMGASDPFNPDGETLASERFPVILPTITGRGLRVAINWAAVPDAVGYRIYRSPAADDVAGSERLLAEVVGGGVLSYTDDATVATGSMAPLEIGATGTWHVVATLNNARYGAGVTALADPADANTWHLFVAGGRDDSAVLDSIENISITLEADSSQTVTAPAISGQTLSAARWQVGIYSVTHAIASRVVEGQPWIYIVGGTLDLAGGSGERDVEAYPLLAGGLLGAPIAVDNIQGSAGFGYAAANNFLHAFGGRGGTATNGVTSAEMCGLDNPCVTGGMDPPDPPDLVNWNNAGVSMSASRVHLGTAVLPGFIYLLGGSDGTDALDSTEFLNW